MALGETGRDKRPFRELSRPPRRFEEPHLGAEEGARIVTAMRALTPPWRAHGAAGVDGCAWTVSATGVP